MAHCSYGLVKLWSDRRHPSKYNRTWLDIWLEKQIKLKLFWCIEIYFKRYLEGNIYYKTSFELIIDVLVTTTYLKIYKYSNLQKKKILHRNFKKNYTFRKMGFPNRTVIHGETKLILYRYFKCLEMKTRNLRNINNYLTY